MVAVELEGDISGDSIEAATTATKKEGGFRRRKRES
jgi:hypothetical protein